MQSQSWLFKLSGVKTKIICRVDNTISLQKRTLIKKVIEKMLYRFVISRADRIVIVSGTAAEDLSEYAKIPEDRIRTIFNPVITNDITAKKQVQPDHQWYEAGIPVVLAIGRLTPVKNFSWLIQVFSLLLEKVDARLIILGEGQERGELQNMISDLHLEGKIDLPGFVDNPFAYMQNSNAFVLTSLYEGLPTVLIEAMACGCPIVSVDCPSGPAEILGGGEFGYLVPMGEKETFVDALVNTIEGRVEQVPSAWLEQFTLEYVAEQYLDEIEKLME